MSRLDLRVVETNDPTLELLCSQHNPLTNSTVPTDMTGLLVECYVKPSKDVADDDVINTTVYSSASASQIVITDATLAEHGVNATGAVAKVFLNDMNLGTTLWYHLDVVDTAGRRITYAYGRLRVANV